MYALPPSSYPILWKKFRDVCCLHQWHAIKLNHWRGVGLIIEITYNYSYTLLMQM